MFYDSKSVENYVFTHMIGHVFTLHYSEIFYGLRLLTIYHRATLKNYVETVLLCKAVFYLCEWAVVQRKTNLKHNS